MSISFIQKLIIKLGKIMDHRSRIIYSIELARYDILGDVSVSFVKDAESVINLYFKFIIENPTNYYDKKEAKIIIFKIMSYIVNLMGKISEIIKDDNIKENKGLFVNGMLKMHNLKEDYIYLLRN
jgi:hypothetical protein